MSTDTKRPYNAVLPIARALLAKLRPVCKRIELAGSLRRQALWVGDIEVVAIPRPNLDMFEQPTGTTEVDTLVDDWARRRYVATIKNGSKYKQFRFEGKKSKTLYTVDLFLQSEETWPINLLLRTGSAEFSKAMVTPRHKGGLMPDHYRFAGARIWDGSQALSLREEEEIFALYGMDYIEPKERYRIPEAI